MTEETQSKEEKQILSIEEAIARSIPFTSHWVLNIKPLRKLVYDCPLYFGLGNGKRRLYGLKELFRDKPHTVELLNKTVELKINGKDYLSLYRRLLSNPKYVEEYIDLLHPEVRTETARKREINWIQTLFGIQDHSRLELGFNKFNQKFDKKRLEGELTTKSDFVPRGFDERTGNCNYWIYRDCLTYLKRYDWDTYYPSLGVIDGISVCPNTSEDHPDKIIIDFESCFVLPSARNDVHRQNICLEGFERIIDWAYSLNPDEIVFSPGDNVAIYPTFHRDIQTKRTPAEGEKQHN